MIVTQPVVQEAMDSSKENFSSPVLTISGGSNIIINFGTMLQKNWKHPKTVLTTLLDCMI